MYNWEIDNIMKANNYNLPSYLYLDICQQSPQINFIKRIDGNKYKIVAKDENNNSREWVFSIFLDNRKC